MIRIFYFVFTLQQDVALRSEVYALMDQHLPAEIDIAGWHLRFDPAREMITVTSNDTDEFLGSKFLPGEINYYALRVLCDKNETPDEQQMYLKIIS